MNDFKLNPIGLAKPLPGPGKALTGKNSRLPEPCRSLPDRDFRTEVPELNRKSEGLIL